MGLLLRAVDVAGPLRWRWLLTDADTGAPLADHQVDLEPVDVARFSDLSGYLRFYAAPDRQVEDGARIVADAGGWGGSVLLGDAVGKAIVAATATGAVTVQVVAPPPADAVLLWPLELAHAAGRPLAARGDVTFVYDITGRAAAAETAATGPEPSATRPASAARGRTGNTPLRVLAVFSQPTRTSVLALRRERYALARLIRRVAAKERAAVELRVLQYGVTRKILGDIAAEGDGWDLLHLSGHGAGGAFLLEKSDGSMDIVSTADLVGLLGPMRGRARLAVVSACSSAADATARTYRLLGLTEQAQALETEASQELAEAATEIPGLARALVRDLGCPVVGMRYPVTDEFAIAFGGALYEEILTRKVPVDVAVARAVSSAARPQAQPSDAVPAISLATPGVFGAHDPSLRIDIPGSPPDFAEQKMAYFPDEPARFVGRAAAMAKASAALAPDSGKTGILLHGMAGAGKTACALELAYRHQDTFSVLAFWQAPSKDEEWASGLADFATRLDIQLADYGFTMISHIATEASLRAFAPRLRRLLADKGILLVLDNLETLLTSDGTWRDPRWHLLINALTSHDGESRVILTSRVTPAELSAATSTQVLTLPVHALSLGEAAALARELPNLRALLHSDAGSTRSIAPMVDADRDRVRRVLRVVQGHPKLMELADAAAANRDRLDRQLAAAEAAAASAAATGGVSAAHKLDAFFRDGETTLDPDGFMVALSDWTHAALSALPPQARQMAGFLTSLEDADRRSDVIWSTWHPLWRHLHRPGDPPDPGPLLAALAEAALLEHEPIRNAETMIVHPPANKASAGGQDGEADDATGGELGWLSAGPAVQPTAYRVHPGVAAAIAGAVEPAIRDAVDGELSAYWSTVTHWALKREGGEDSTLVVRAGLAAAPYLLRRQEWDAVSTLLREAVVRDASPAVLEAVLPLVRRSTQAGGSARSSGLLGSLLRQVDPAEAERLLRSAVSATAGEGDFSSASLHAEELCGLLMDTGRSREALAVAEQMSQFSRQAGLGPWTQLADRSWRLRVLAQMGKHAQVLAEVEQLRAVMAGIPDRTEQPELATAWYARESILLAGEWSAMEMGHWARGVGLNDEIVASKMRRGAGEHDIALTWINNAEPMIIVGRLVDAERLLAECQRIFENHADVANLAAVFSHRAKLENKLGRPRTAMDLQLIALRLFYARPELTHIAASHQYLATCLIAVGGDLAAQWAHQLAAALIYRLTGMTYGITYTARVLSDELHADGGTDPSLPSTVAQVINVTEQSEGVHLGALLSALEPDPAALESALAEILTAAAAAALPSERAEPGEGASA